MESNVHIGQSNAEAQTGIHAEHSKTTRRGVGLYVSSDGPWTKVRYTPLNNPCRSVTAWRPDLKYEPTPQTFQPVL